MNNQEAYDSWSLIYDTALNKTRDLEAKAIRAMLGSFAALPGADLPFDSILELGCGTGKNTEWLHTRAARLVGADFSPDMLARAKAKIVAPQVRFVQTDLRHHWDFADGEFDLVTVSLVLEHIEDLDFIFREASRVLKPGGHFYLGELHPFKQYLGSKARFDTENGVFELECFVHHTSEFFAAAKQNGFALTDLQEWFDAGDRSAVPRLLTMIYRKI